MKNVTLSTGISHGDIAKLNRFTISVKVQCTNSAEPDKGFETTFSRYEESPSEESFESAKNKYTDDILNLTIEDIYKKAFVNW